MSFTRHVTSIFLLSKPGVKVEFSFGGGERILCPKYWPLPNENFIEGTPDRDTSDHVSWEGAFSAVS